MSSKALEDQEMGKEHETRSDGRQRAKQRSSPNNELRPDWEIAERSARVDRFLWALESREHRFTVSRKMGSGITGE